MLNSQMSLQILALFMDKGLLESAEAKDIINRFLNQTLGIGAHAEPSVRDLASELAGHGGMAEVLIQSETALRRGTAFRVGERLLVTGAHILNDDIQSNSLEIIFNGESETRSGRVLYSDSKTDLAIIEAAPLDGTKQIENTNSSNRNVKEILIYLAAAIAERYERSAQIEDLDGAIRLYSEALHLTESRQPEDAVILSNLAAALRTRFDGTGERADLDDAVSLLRQALELAPPGQPERPVILSNLAAALQTRFDGTGERADLDGCGSFEVS